MKKTIVALCIAFVVFSNAMGMEGRRTGVNSPYRYFGRAVHRRADDSNANAMGMSSTTRVRTDGYDAVVERGSDGSETMIGEAPNGSFTGEKRSDGSEIITGRSHDGRSSFVSTTAPDGSSVVSLREGGSSAVYRERKDGSLELLTSSGSALERIAKGAAIGGVIGGGLAFAATTPAIAVNVVGYLFGRSVTTDARLTAKRSEITARAALVGAALGGAVSTVVEAGRWVCGE